MPHFQLMTMDGDGGVVSVLSALQRYVVERGIGAARVGLDGKTYTLEALPRDDGVKQTD